MSDPPVSLADMVEAIRRECDAIRFRYSLAVSRGQMNRRQADRRIDVMDALLRFLEQRQREEAQDGRAAMER